MDLTEMPRAGQCGVYLGDLHEVEERRVERVWYALAPEGVKTERYGKKEETVKKQQRGSRRSKGAKKQRRSSTIDEEEVTVKKGPNLGRVEFALRWIHNPELVVTLPEQITRDEVHPDEEANSLLITLVRCRNLPVMDTGVFGGSSDPYCVIRVGDERVKSTVRKKDLNPVWVESFELPNSDKDAKVVFEVLDYDAYGTSDASFTYVAAPRVLALSPRMGWTAGGYDVDVRLSQNVQSCSCTFDELSVEGTVVDDTVRCRAPLLQEGTVAVKVTCGSGTHELRVRRPAEVFSTQPARGSERGGSLIKLSGRNFPNVASLECVFGGV